LYKLNPTFRAVCPTPEPQIGLFGYEKYGIYVPYHYNNNRVLIYTARIGLKSPFTPAVGY
jgi:hypothetical protein